MTRRFEFKPRQFLGAPRVTAPPRQGHVAAAVQFVVPGLSIGSGERESVLKLCSRLGREVHGAVVDKVTADDNKRVGTLVAMAFHVPEASSEDDLQARVDDAAIELVERLLGALSFFAGMRLAAIHTQTTIVREGGRLSTALQPISRAGETKIPFELPDEPFATQAPSAEIFNALFWLRRGLAERDPLETYAALMVSLQAIAREVAGEKTEKQQCPKCKHETSRPAGISAMVRELVVGRLGAAEELFKRLWKIRNAVVAHGNRAVDARTFVELTDLKFDAANVCYKGIKLALGMLPNEGPRPDPSFFVTSALMYVE